MRNKKKLYNVLLTRNQSVSLSFSSVIEVWSCQFWVNYSSISSFMTLWLHFFYSETRIYRLVKQFDFKGSLEFSHISFDSLNVYLHLNSDFFSFSSIKNFKSTWYLWGKSSSEFVFTTDLRWCLIILCSKIINLVTTNGILRKQILILVSTQTSQRRQKS